VKDKLIEAWTIFIKTVPQLSKSNTTDEPKEQLELVQVTWTELVEQAENLEAQL